jgi:hypothetical protein
MDNWQGADTHHIITAMICLNTESYIALVVYRCCIWELVCLEMDKRYCLAWTVLELAHDLSIYWTPGENKHVRMYCQLQSLHSVCWNSEQNESTEIANHLCNCFYRLMRVISHTLLHLSPTVLVLPCPRLSTVWTDFQCIMAIHGSVCHLNTLDQDKIW